jgi:hypothetical protein
MRCFKPPPENVSQVFRIQLQGEFLQHLHPRLLPERLPEFRVVHQPADGAGDRTGVARRH